MAFSIGCFIPFQGIITSNLSQKIQHPFGAAFVNFFGGMLLFLFAISVSSVALPSIKKVMTIPWYLFTGGVVGSVFIFGALFALPKIGASTFFGQIVLGQLLMTLIVDHYGVFGLPIHKIDSIRIIGVALLISGAFLILKK
ncbi:MAG: DMT family transporter [Bacteriovorax sp.]|nr:DMT family transporter [Bacteriovorax sp.]